MENLTRFLLARNFMNGQSRIIETGRLSGVHLNGKDSYYNVALPNGTEERFQVEGEAAMDVFWYYVGHCGDPVYKVGCVKCGNPLWSFLDPTGFPHGPVCVQCSSVS